MLNRRSVLQLIGSVSVIAGAGVGVGPALARRQAPHRHGRQGARQRLLRRLPRRRRRGGQGTRQRRFDLHRPDQGDGRGADRRHRLADRAESRRHRDFGQRHQRAGAGLQEGDEPRHQGDFVRLRHRSGRPDHAPQPLQQRAHRRQVRADDGQDPEERRRRRHPFGDGAGHEPEHLDRGDEEGMGQARLREDEAGRDRLRRRRRGQELPRDARLDQSLSEPQGHHCADVGRHRRGGQGGRRRGPGRQGLRHRPRPALGNEGRRARRRDRHLRDLEPDRSRLQRDR